MKSHQISRSSTETYTLLMAVFAVAVVVTGLLVPRLRKRCALVNSSSPYSSGVSA